MVAAAGRRAAGVRALSRCFPFAGRSARQGPDLDHVVGEDPESGPDLRPLGAVQPGAVPSVSPFEASDPVLAARPGVDRLAETLAGVPRPVAPCRACPWAGSRQCAHPDRADHPRHRPRRIRGRRVSVRVRRPARAMTRFTAGASCGASGGLPCSRVWSRTTPSSCPRPGP